MRTVGAHEAKTHLAELLEALANGERVTITKHGTPVAMLVPAHHVERPDPPTAVDAVRKFRRGITLGGPLLKQMIEEGRS